MNTYAVIVAGGAGTRMASVLPKQFLLLHNRPVLWYTLRSFLEAFNTIELILVLPAEYLQQGADIAAALPKTAGQQIHLVAGGATRFHSVQNGLQQVPPEAVVLVHDGVRCLVTPQLIRNCCAQAIEKGSAIPAVAATDSIRIVSGDTHRVANRNQVRIIQTPQTFRSNLLLKAFRQPYQESFTDEATVVEAAGETVFLIEGEYNNIKITRPADLLVAAQLVQPAG